MRNVTDINEKEDRECISQCLLGEASYFRPLVDRYEVVVKTLISRLVRNPQEVEELAHQTFIAAYTKLSSYSGRSKFSTWLCQIALNKARDYLRSKKRERVHLDITQLDIASGWADPLSNVVADQEGEVLAVAISKLNAKDQKALTLRYMYEYDYATVGEIMACSKESAKIRCFRARASLKSILHKMDLGTYFTKEYNEKVG